MVAPDSSYGALVEAKLAPPKQTVSDIKKVLEANIIEGRIAGFPLAQMDDPLMREAAYSALAAQGQRAYFDHPRGTRCGALKPCVL